MKKLRYMAFGIFIALAIIGARVQVYAWSSFSEWSGYYGSVCTSFDFGETANDFYSGCSCDPEDAVCVAAAESFCDGFYDVCYDYCVQTWPGPDQGVVFADCGWCSCKPIE